MKTPYCEINGIQYQLVFSKTGVLRFPDDKRPMPDLNQMTVDYITGKIPLSNLFEYDVNSGSSYERVFGIFSKDGMNNHIVAQGPEPTKEFILFTENEELNTYWNE